MQDNNQQNFNVVTTSKSSRKSKTALIVGGIVVLFLAISIPAGVYLVKQQQNIKEKAESALECPAAEACPVAGEASLLRSCQALTSGETPMEISCATIVNVGTTTFCGSTKYCCPSLGAAWTTDLTLCATPSPTPTVTPTLSPTASASATPTRTASLSATPTIAPIPVTGTNWPTLVGAGVGILVIVGSILLAL